MNRQKMKEGDTQSQREREGRIKGGKTTGETDILLKAKVIVKTRIDSRKGRTEIMKWRNRGLESPGDRTMEEDEEM